MKSGVPQGLVLGLHPMSRGFSWIAYSGPFAPYDWRIVETKGADKNAACVRRVEKLLDRLQPTMLVLEAFERTDSKRTWRITKLGRTLSALAANRGIEVGVLTRLEVQSCFLQVGARTREEVAEAVARHTPMLADALPPKRQAWDNENLRMTLFSAAALVITHYALDANRVLDALSSQ